MVSTSRPIIRDQQLLKRELDRLGLHQDSKWLPSVLNKYEGTLSRRFPRGDLQIRRSLRRSVMAGMQAPVESFPYRPLGEHPVFLRSQTLQEVEQTWRDRQMQHGSFTPDEPNRASSAEGSSIGEPRGVADSRLAAAVLARDGSVNGYPCLSPSGSPLRDVGHSEDHEPVLAPAACGSEPAAGSVTLGSPTPAHPGQSGVTALGTDAYLSLV
jgi:hypothetical protein